MVHSTSSLQRVWTLEGTWRRSTRFCAIGYACAELKIPNRALASCNAQSVKSTGVGAIRGYDGAKKLSGRKRHVLVDMLGMVLKALGCTRRTYKKIVQRCLWCWKERPKSSLALNICG
jgi:hypothetical protein